MGGLNRIDTVEVTVENKASREIAGLVLVLERILFAYWNAAVQGPSVTKKQQADFNQNIERTDGGTIIMKLPPVASKKSLTVLLHGNLVTGAAHLTVPEGVRYRIDTIIPMRQTFVTKFLRWEIPYLD
jgi:hypothetical protein